MSIGNLCANIKKNGRKERRTKCLRLRGNRRNIKGMKSSKRKKLTIGWLDFFMIGFKSQNISIKTSRWSHLLRLMVRFQERRWKLG